MPSLISFARHGLAALAVAVLVGWALPLPAAAEAGSIARVDRTGEPGATLHFTTGDSATTTLFNLRVDDDTAVGAYCVDVSASVDHRAAYAEAGWADLPADRALASESGRVTWIVRNSYPALDLARLSADSGVADLTAAQAIGGTQAAVWHLTNGVRLRTDGAADHDPAQVRALYEYLLEAAEEEAEASPALAVTPAEVVGEASAPLGPLAVRTTSELPVRLAVNGAEGAVLVDSDGDRVTEAGNGDEVLLALPEGTGAGAATVYAHADEATVATGRVYVGRDGVRTQPLVVAERATASLTVSAKVSWSDPATTVGEASPTESPRPTAAPNTPSPNPSLPAPPPPLEPVSPVPIAEDKRPESELPFTGTWLGAIVFVAVALLGCGAAAMLLTRRRE